MRKDKCLAVVLDAPLGLAIVFERLGTCLGLDGEDAVASYDHMIHVEVVRRHVVKHAITFAHKLIQFLARRQLSIQRKTETANAFECLNELDDDVGKENNDRQRENKYRRNVAAPEEALLRVRRVKKQRHARKHTKIRGHVERQIVNDDPQRLPRTSKGGGGGGRGAAGAPRGPRPERRRT